MGHARITFVYFKVFYISVSSGDDIDAKRSIFRNFFLAKYIRQDKKDSTHLTIEQRRVIVDIGDFNGERANTFQGRFTLIRCFHGNGYKFTIVSFAIEYLKISTRFYHLFV